MNDDLDPLNGDAEAGPILPSRESIKSFWVGSSGLAVLAILASIGVFTLGSLDSRLVSLLNIPFGQRYWNACYGINIVIGSSLIPGLVLGALVPILYWRGGAFSAICSLGSPTCLLPIGEYADVGSRLFVAGTRPLGCALTKPSPERSRMLLAPDEGPIEHFASTSLEFSRHRTGKWSVPPCASATWWS